MKIRELLDRKGRKIITVQPYENVAFATHRLRMEHVGALIVSSIGTIMLGIVTERDIVACVAERGSEAVHVRVANIMSRRVVTCTEEDTVARTARLMTEEHCRHIPVLRAGKLAGIVSIGDIVKQRLEEVELEVGVLRDLARAAKMPGDAPGLT